MSAMNSQKDTPSVAIYNLIDRYVLVVDSTLKQNVSLKYQNRDLVGEPLRLEEFLFLRKNVSDLIFI